MKYITLLCDGMADVPVAELNGKTPMEVANKPNMDNLARNSEIGMVRTIPEGMDAGSDVANLSVLGYDPMKYYSGRSPLEVLSMGIQMNPEDVSFRCNLVTLTNEQDNYEDKIIIDNSANDISTEEARILIKDLVASLNVDDCEFYTGMGYRHIVIERSGTLVKLAPPHDILQKKIGDYLPTHPMLKNMMVRSYEILKSHPINVARSERGLNPANSIWFWGGGFRPNLPSYSEKFNLKGAIFSATDLMKGIAVGTNMDILFVEGASGGLHTNYEGIAARCVKALIEDNYDFTYLHMEAPDELSHQGDLESKILAIEYIDEKIIPIILEGLMGANEDFRLLILPDHPTPITLRTHTADPVPYLIYDSRKKIPGCQSFTEQNAAAFRRLIEPGHNLVHRLFVR